MNAYRKADAVMKIVEADIKALKKALDSKFPNGLREIVGSTFKGIIGTDPAWATLPKTLNSVVLLENKLSGVVVLNRNASKKIINALDACDKLEQELKKSKNDKATKKVFLKLKQMRLSLNGSLDACVTYGGHVENISDKLPDLKKNLKALSGVNPKYAQIFEKVFPMAVNFGLKGSKGVLDIKEADSTLEKATEALALSIELGSDIKQ